ncbi:MAG: hypothetical protein ACFE8B_15695 [Candidatus Hermodarchaeota archaeon]
MKKNITGLIVILFGICAVGIPLSLIQGNYSQDKLSNPNDLPNKEDPNKGDKNIIEVCVDFNPDTLNCKSKGKWVTVFIELPNDIDITNIQFESIQLNDEISAEKIVVRSEEGDDFYILVVKFDRYSVINILEPADVVEISVSGKFNDGGKFQGKDSINLINY